MRVLIVYAHPNPDSYTAAVRESFTAGLRKAGHEFELIDLYTRQFNPILTLDDLRDLRIGRVADDIAADQGKVSNAEALVFIAPVWWFSFPAALKGWIDRVFSSGFAFNICEDGRPEGLLHHRKALTIMPCGSTEHIFEKYGYRTAMETCINHGIFHFCGIDDARLILLYNVINTTDEVRREYLERVHEIGVEF